jgi:hypothetical protein
MAQSSVPDSQNGAKSGWTLNMDWWSVLLALLAAALVKAGWLPHVPW